MSVEDESLDILQDMEFAIVTEFHRDPSILDLNVEDAMAALIAFYEAGRRPAPSRLSERSLSIFEAVKKICELRMERAGEISDADDPIAPDEVVACLKRIRKSIVRWNKTGGRQGYLSFVSQYVD